MAGIYELDMNKFTLVGKDITREDLVILLAVYSFKHPDDKLIRDVIEFWHGIAIKQNS